LLANAADININLGGTRVQAPGVSVTFGSRDNRGYYWDGYDYREPAYWKQHDGPRGERYYTAHGNRDEHRRRDDRDDHREGGRHCPPGQAKKGNC
jgi:hypothetical protein